MKIYLISCFIRECGIRPDLVDCLDLKFSRESIYKSLTLFWIKKVKDFAIWFLLCEKLERWITWQFLYDQNTIFFLNKTKIRLIYSFIFKWYNIMNEKINGKYCSIIWVWLKFKISFVFWIFSRFPWLTYSTT